MRRAGRKLTHYRIVRCMAHLLRVAVQCKVFQAVPFDICRKAMRSLQQVRMTRPTRQAQ